MSDPQRWLALWHPSRETGYALDYYPDERARYVREVITDGYVILGDHSHRTFAEFDVLDQMFLAASATVPLR
jgi:hypothetical protein